MLFPKQQYYVPYLNSLYPGGLNIPYTHPTEGFMFSMYHIPQESWAKAQGATAQTPDGKAVNVPTLGAPPPGVSLRYPASVRWQAGLRVPRYWNYVFQIGPGPAKLVIDGRPVLDLNANVPVLRTTVALARGVHSID